MKSAPPMTVIFLFMFAPVVVSLAYSVLRASLAGKVFGAAASRAIVRWFFPATSRRLREIAVFGRNRKILPDRMVADLRIIMLMIRKERMNAKLRNRRKKLGYKLCVYCSCQSWWTMQSEVTLWSDMVESMGGSAVARSRKYSSDQVSRSSGCCRMTVLVNSFSSGTSCSGMCTVTGKVWTSCVMIWNKVRWYCNLLMKRLWCRL